MKVACAFAALVASGDAFTFPSTKLLGARRSTSPLSAGDGDDSEANNLRNIAIIGRANEWSGTICAIFKIEFKD
jgi:hypothetical protein